MEQNKLEQIIKERNQVICHYKEKCGGLEQVNSLLESILYSVICSSAEVVINKMKLREGMGKHRVALYDDGTNYYISAIDVSADTSPEGDEDEKD